MSEAVKVDEALDETVVMHVGSSFLHYDHEPCLSAGRIDRRWAVFATNMHIFEITNRIRQLIFRQLKVEHAIHATPESRGNGCPVFKAATRW